MILLKYFLYYVLSSLNIVHIYTSYILFLVFKKSFRIINHLSLKYYIFIFLICFIYLKSEFEEDHNLFFTQNFKPYHFPFNFSPPHKNASFTKILIVHFFFFLCDPFPKSIRFLNNVLKQ